MEEERSGERKLKNSRLGNMEQRQLQVYYYLELFACIEQTFLWTTGHNVRVQLYVISIF